MRKRYFHWVWGFALVLVLNMSYLFLRQTQALLLLGETENTNLVKFLKIMIPAGSRVVGEEAFYYAAIEAGLNFEICRWKLHEDEREKLHREIYDYQYFISSYPPKPNDPFWSYFQRCSLVALDTFAIGNKDSEPPMPYFYVDRRGLGCIIWKRESQKNNSD